MIPTKVNEDLYKYFKSIGTQYSMADAAGHYDYP